MDNERKIVDLNKPHLLGKHYPAARSVPTLAERAALFNHSKIRKHIGTLYKDQGPLYDISRDLKN